MKLLTISIAAYNVEKYIDKALAEFVDDKFIDKLEVLIINDGSLDRTGEIAAKYEMAYPEIFKLVDKKNGGHGSTINCGIKLARGKYFRILDGDDFFDKFALLDFLNRLEICDDDMVVSDYRCVTENGEVYVDDVFRGVNVFKKFKDNVAYNIDNRLEYSNVIVLPSITIKTKLLKDANVFISERCFYVDMEYNLFAIILSKTFRFYSTPIYMYLKNHGNNSVSKENMIKNIAMQEKVLFKMIDIFIMYRENIFREKKHILISRNLSAMLGSIIRTYMLMPDTLKKIKLLDIQIKSRSWEVYIMIGHDWFIRCVRSENYFLVPLIKLAYKIWLNCRK